MNDVSYTWDDLAALAPEWFQVFGEPMPMGFEVTPHQVPIIRECIRIRSQKPLGDYVLSLPKDQMY